MLLAKFPLWIIPVLFGGLLVVSIAAAIVNAKKRRLLVAQATSAAGLSLDPAPDQAARAQAWEHVGAMRDLNRGANGVKWCAAGTIDGRQVHLLEHAYAVSTGKSTHVVRHTIAATPCPTTWPHLKVEEENLLTKLAGALGRKDFQLESEAFNKRWRVSTDNEDFALLVLTPAVQEWLMGLPKGTSLRIGSGALCMVRHNCTTPGDLGPLATLPGDALDRLPADLTSFA